MRKLVKLIFLIDVIMVISIMELLSVFNAKNNVMLVHRHQLFVYHVTELIGFHGLHLIMIASKYNFI